MLPCLKAGDLEQSGSFFLTKMILSGIMFSFFYFQMTPEIQLPRKGYLKNVIEQEKRVKELLNFLKEMIDQMRRYLF